MDVLRWVALKGVIGSGWLRQAQLLADVQKRVCFQVVLPPSTRQPNATCPPASLSQRLQSMGPGRYDWPGQAGVARENSTRDP